MRAFSAGGFSFQLVFLCTLPNTHNGKWFAYPGIGGGNSRYDRLCSRRMH